MLSILQSLLGYFARLPGAVVHGWDRFFFTPRDPIVLGIIRIMVGSVLFYIHLSCASNVLDFIGPNAWMDEQTFTELYELEHHPKYKISPDALQNEIDLAAVRKRAMQRHGFSIWFLVNDPCLIRTIYYAGIVVIGLFTIGFCTRVTGILSWAFHLSYIHRSMMIWFGMDAMVSFMMLYLCISPCGSVLSVDRYLAQRRSKWTLGPVQPMWSATLALRLMQIHMCVVYFIAGIAKLQGHTWWNGLATWLTMNAPLFNEGIDIGWLADTRYGEWFWHYFTFVSTYITLGFEIAFPFLIWNRYLRPWMIFLAIMLHAGIGVFMGLGGFGAVMLAGCFSFLPAKGVRWAWACLTGKPAH
jgi:hypothetical protein